MKRLVLVPLLMAALLLSAAPVAATPPGAAAGDWTYVVDLDGLSFRTAGNTTFIDGTEVSTLTGTFDGTATDDFVVVCHQKKDGVASNFAKITVEFTGEVDGREGEMTMVSTGRQESTTCNPSDAVWYGTWVIVGGTGGLADLHGTGTWTGPSFTLTYEGQIHFD